MASLLERPLGDFIASPGNRRDVSDVAEVLIARTASLVYALTLRAPPAAIFRAATAGTSADLLRAIADLLQYESSVTGEGFGNHLPGRVALAKALEESGGVLLADEAMRRLNVSPVALERWRESFQVLAVQVEDGTWVYPIAQFERPRRDTSYPRPYQAIAEIRRVAGDRLTIDELVGLLSARQDALANDAGPRTGFQAIADGDASRVIELVRHVASPSDASAPATPSPGSLSVDASSRGDDQ